MNELFERAIPVTSFAELDGLHVQLRTVRSDGLTYLFAFGEYAIYVLGEEGSTFRRKS